jgi:hypothetical protein
MVHLTASAKEPVRSDPTGRHVFISPPEDVAFVLTSASSRGSASSEKKRLPLPSRTGKTRRTAFGMRPLGRSALKCFTDWNDCRPETELNFKFYRQATNKVIGISDEAASFLGGFF